MSVEGKFAPPGYASLDTATTGTGGVLAANDGAQVSWFVTYPGTAPSSGTVVIEHAPARDYAGTWNLLDTVTCANLSAGTEGFGTFPGPLSFVRARITSNPNQAISVYLQVLINTGHSVH